MKNRFLQVLLLGTVLISGSGVADNAYYFERDPSGIIYINRKEDGATLASLVEGEWEITPAGEKSGFSMGHFGNLKTKDLGVISPDDADIYAGSPNVADSDPHADAFLGGLKEHNPLPESVDLSPHVLDTQEGRDAVINALEDVKAQYANKDLSKEAGVLSQNPEPDVDGSWSKPPEVELKPPAEGSGLPKEAGLDDGTTYDVEVASHGDEVDFTSEAGYDRRSPTYDPKADYDYEAVNGGSENIPQQNESLPETKGGTSQTEAREPADNPAAKNADFDPAKDPEVKSDTPEADKVAERPEEVQKEAEKGKTEGEEKAKETPHTVIQFNYLQYALLIWEAIKGTQIDDATKRVKVKGADPMNDSQGTPSSGASTEMPNAPMSGTTIADSANALITLLDMGKIDLSLLSTDIQKSTVKLKPAVTGSAGTSDGVEVKSKDTTLATTGSTLTSEEHKEILRRRALLLGEWATAATQIGEGSNAISSTFYERASAFAAAANAAQGSLGGISTITDTDRFVLFELTRSAALSAIQLGLQGAMNLNALDETASAR